MKKSLLSAGAALLALGASAQSTTNFIETIDSVNVYNIMLENAPQRPKMKDVPRFTLVGKDSKFYLGFGANLKFVGDFDWNNPVDDANNFAPANIPMSVKPGDGGKTQFSIGQSNFYMNFVALPGTSNQLGIFLDINFLGSSPKAVALHHAYLKYRGITAGYVHSVFTDLAAEPYSIDFAGPNSITFRRIPNISYTQKFGKDKMWSASLGFDLPSMAAFTTATGTERVNQRMPNIPIAIQRTWAGGQGWLRASAIFRDLYYRNTITGRNEGELGWGVKVSGKTPIVGGLSCSYQGVYGKGIATYINDLEGTSLDLVPVAGEAGKLQTVKAWGAYGSLRYDFSPKVFMNVTYSHVRAYTPADVAGADTYKYGQYVTSNLIWNINSFASCGIEYLWGRRVNFDGMQAHDNRIMVMLQVSI